MSPSRADFASALFRELEDRWPQSPDIVQTCSMEAPVLLPPLFVGLIWRSECTESGMRRVDCFDLHLLVDASGSLALIRDWIAHSMLAVLIWRWERSSGSLRLDKRLEFYLVRGLDFACRRSVCVCVCVCECM